MTIAPTPAASRSIAGLISLIAAIITVLGTTIQIGLLPLLTLAAYRFDVPPVALYQTTNVMVGIIAGVALVAGIIGLLVRDRPRRAAIIGVTAGVSYLVPAVLGNIIGLVVGAAL